SGVAVGGAAVGDVAPGRVSELIDTCTRVVVGSGGNVTVVVVSGSGSVVVGSGTTMVDVVTGRVREVVDTRPRVVVGSGGSVSVGVVWGSGGSVTVVVVRGRDSVVVGRGAEKGEARWGGAAAAWGGAVG